MTSQHPARWVGHCTCGTWDGRHELGCGWDVDDRPRPPVSGPVAAMPFAGVPVAAARLERSPYLLPEHEVTHADLVVLTAWMAGPGGCDVDDLVDAVACPWKWEVELAEARDWAEQTHTERKTA